MSEHDTEQEQDEALEAMGAPVSVDPVEDDDESPDDADTQQDAAQGQHEPSEPPAETLAELEEKRAKLARSATTWRNRVSDVLGEEAQILVPCELCEPDIPGFHFPAEFMQPESELDERLIAALRGGDRPDYPEASDVRRCDVCAGYGNVRTGSRVAGRETKTCAACVGYGYLPPPTLGNNGPAPEGRTGELVPVGASPGLQDDADAWGSPRLLPDGRDNPNYGKMPQYKDAALP